MKSKRARLRHLFNKHPDWKAPQFAAALGQKVESVRAAMSVMGLKTGKPRDNEKREKMELSKPQLKYEPTVGAIAGSMRPRSTAGYLKLM